MRIALHLPASAILGDSAPAQLHRRAGEPARQLLYACEHGGSIAGLTQQHGVVLADATRRDHPIVYANARAGRAGTSPDALAPDLSPLFDVLVEAIPPPSYDPSHPLQALVTNLDASPYVGRLALLRIHHGTLRKGQQIAWCRADGTIENARVTELLVTDALDRVPAEEAGPGEIIALAGLPEVTIGETIADPADPRPLPVTTVDEPSLSVTIGINTSPLAGTEGSKVNASQIKQRLDQELIGNVSLRVSPTSRPDAWEVQGRGELQLAVLVELMRREGFELTVGKPEVLTKTIDGKRHEPVERVAVDIPEDYIGVVTQLLALRKGRIQQMVNHGTGWARMEYLVPARGLIGFRTEFLTETRGTGILHHVFEAWEPWHGELRTRPTGSLVADRRGQATGHAIEALQERGILAKETHGQVIRFAPPLIIDKATLQLALDEIAAVLRTDARAR